MAEEPIQAIDVMNYLQTEKQLKASLNSREFQTMFRTIFHLPPGAGVWPSKSPQQLVKEMDEAHFEKTLLPAVKMWSWRDQRLIFDTTVEEVHDFVKEAPDRLVGLAGYNPFRIKDSLDEIERSVKKYGFKGVYAHLIGFGVAPNDRRAYPCYAKCIELGIPFSIQMGHSLETLPSEPGRPIYLDEVALDFPELTIICSHTGWPWCEEAIAMSWKWENVYLDISAHLPRYVDPSIIHNMDTRMQDKVLFGTNGLGFKLTYDQFVGLNIKPDTKRKVLRDNAIKVFKL